jgi:O-antigen/teichoic acid export membrane protein
MQMTISQLSETILLKGEGGDRNIFARNVLSTFIAKGLALILTVVTSAIIARWLGPEGKGMLALALLVPGTLVIFLSFGIGVSNVYFIGSRRLDLPTLTKNSVSFALLATILGAGIIFFLLVSGWLEALLPQVPTWLILIALVGFPIGLLSGYFITILQGLQFIITLNIVNLSQGGLTLILIIFFIIGFDLGIVGALVSYLGAGLLGLIVLTMILRREGGIFKASWNPLIMRSTLSFGLKGQIGNILQFFNYRLDLFIVNYFLGPKDVGIYSVSVGLAELLWHFPNAVSFVIFPKAANTKPELLKNFTPRVFLITLGFTAVGAIGLLFLGKPIISIIYSSTFLAAYVPMLALLPGVVLLGGAKVLTNEIAGRGNPQYNSINAGLSLAITVILDLLLIPKYGVLGAALASSIAYTMIFFTAVGFHLVVRRKNLSD